VATITITPRRRKTRTSYVVRYRLGGRAYPLVRGGAFRTVREARSRRDLIAGEIAAGRNPAELLARLHEQPEIVTVSEWEGATSRAASISATAPGAS
jgi:hypothetical protein